MHQYKKLANQPLTFALAEFRFSPVLDIADYIPKVQGALRKKYPVSSNISAQVVEMQPSGVRLSQQDRWRFVSANKKSAVEIDQERLVYITSEYPRFEGFSEACEHALECLTNVVELGLLVRIGLRYSDLVKLNDGDALTDLIDHHFGAPECISQHGKLVNHSTHTVMTTAMGALIVRTMYGPHNHACLPDARELPVLFDQTKDEDDRIILDFDHIWEAKSESVNFRTEDALQKLDRLHETARAAFWDVTSDYAKDEKWDS